MHYSKNIISKVLDKWKNIHHLYQSLFKVDEE